MKLRNKKTREIIDLGSITIFECSSKTLGISESIDDFHTIAELNEEWEDYKPKEPLIDDEKIRKALRYIFPEYAMIHIEKQGGKRIFEFGGTRLEIYDPDENAIKHGLSYLINELCGEEEK